MKRRSFQQNEGKYLPVLAAFIASFLLTAGCVNAESLKPSEGPALWRMADEDTEIILFGTVHVMPPGISWRREEIVDAFQAADTIYFETSPDDAGAGSTFAFYRAGLAGPGESVEDVLSEEQFDRVHEAFEEVGLDIDTLKDRKPWLASLIFSVTALEDSGHFSEFGVESWMTEGLSRQQEARSLEGALTVPNALSAMPISDQVSMLMSGFEEPEEGELDDVELVNLSLDAWLQGRDDLIFELVGADLKDEMPVIYDVMFASRNRAWADTIHDLMTSETGNIFIAVGAGHLAGPDSVTALLEEKGWTIERY